jgi:pentatricopeptide repeat protein
VDALAHQAGRPDLADALLSAAAARGLAFLRPPFQPDARWREIIVGSYAVAGDEAKVNALLSADEVSARAYAMAIKGFLKRGHHRPATQHLIGMQRKGLAEASLQARAVAELLRVAVAKGALEEVLQALDGAVVSSSDNSSSLLALLSPDSVAAVLAECAQHEDLASARRVESLARARGIALNPGAMEYLLKLHVREAGSPRAMELLEELQCAGAPPSEGLCGCLLARCSESQNMQLAYALSTYLRSNKMMTLVSYKTLMKVYACGGHYDKACDLYGDLLEDGIEPDSVMYGCLMKFAVMCGRTKLSQDLFEKAGGGCVQNYMWQIRMAGKDGDVGKALELLRRLEASQPDAMDHMVYNCALDACIQKGDMDRAQEVLAAMESNGIRRNLVTYNTLIKGHCARGDLPRVLAVMRDIEAQGLLPDTATYNSFISTAVTAGDLHEVWSILRVMEQRQLPVDQFTVSIVMKAARKTHNLQEAERAFQFLDRAGVNPCEDEVCFNTVLDTCIHRRDKARLRRSLESLASSKMLPTVRTYGLLIKACALLKDTERCVAFWREMTHQRRIVPTDITLSCMIDALIEGHDLEEAVSIFEEWKGTVEPNTVIYSTLIKGFASAGDAERAMATYTEMQAGGIPMNLVAYTALIDANARNGNMAQAMSLFQRMEEDGCQPNTITYSNLVKGFCHRGDLGEAFRTFHEMLSRGLAADAVIFNTLLDGCVRHSRFELADGLLEEMPNYEVEPSNFTLSIVVKMWGKRRHLDKAFEAVREAAGPHSGGKRVDALVGACLVSACIHNGALERALDALAEIKANPKMEGPCISTYSTLVTGFARARYAQKASELAEEACGVKPAANHGADLCGKSKPARPPPMLKPEAFSQLFRALQHHDQYYGGTLAPTLFDRLRAAGVSVDFRWLN